ALAKLPDLEEWSDLHLVKREKWPAWKEAVKTAHTPAPETVPEGLTLPDTTSARRRLAYDELLADQLALAVIRQHLRAGTGR
ncbi:ATP-dependent DNA helicase RecG, partial [Acinetobacter baumannii]